MTIQHVLVVCLGNICRSPMAEGLLSASLPGVKVRSAGLEALVGHPADSIACELMSHCGVNIEEHRAMQVSRDMCQEADLILVMDREQRRVIEERYHFVIGKVFRLCEFSDQDVPDPYLAGREAFRHSLSLIEDGARQWAQRIPRVSSR